MNLYNYPAKPCPHAKRYATPLLLAILLSMTACQPLQLLSGAQPGEETADATTTPVEATPVEEAIEAALLEPTEKAVEEPTAATEAETATPISAATAAISSTIAPTATDTSAPPTTTAAEALTETATITTSTVMTEPVDGSMSEPVEEKRAEPVLTVADLKARQAAMATEELTTTLSISDSITTSVSPPAAVALFASVTTDGSNLNVRSRPSVNAEIVAKLPRDAVVEVLEVSEQQDWYRVEISTDGASGWISAQFTELVELDRSEDDLLSDNSALEAATPDAKNADAAELSTTETLTSSVELSATNTISDPAEISQSLQTTVTVKAVPEFAVPTAITQPANMNVRSGPGTNYPPVTAAPAGTQYEILATNPQGDWLQVRVPNLDEPAWIFAPLADIAGPTDTIPTLSEEELPEPPAPPEAATVSAASVAVSAPPPAGGGFFGYGTQAHMLGGGIDAAMDATANMGFNWMKQQVQWSAFEGSPGAIDFSELRRIADAGSARGINVLFSVVNAPDWAREPGFDPNVGGPPADPQTYANFVGRMAGEFCGSGLKAIEVWNEQNLHYEWGNKPLNPGEYVNLLRAAYNSIKAACPSMLVISGAPTPTGPNGNLAMDDFAYLEAMYQNGVAAVADGIGVHPSGYNVPPSVDFKNACATIQRTGNSFNGACDTPHHSWSFLSTMLGYRNIMNVYNDSNKRLWPTEFGWAAGGALHPAYAYANDNDFNEQAAWTVEAFQMMRNWGWVGPAFLWNLNFRVVADGSEKAQWGIVRNDYSPLPVYDALRAMPK